MLLNLSNQYKGENAYKMTNARYQVEILTKDGWKIVGRSKTEQGAEKQAKQAMKAVPSATDYRIIDRKINLKDSKDMMTDEKKWHDVFAKIVSAIDGVSKPAWGEWGSILSNPSLHVKAYDEILKLWPQLLSYTEKGTDLYDLIDNATNLVKSWRNVANGILNRNKDDMNKSDSQGFEKMIGHHADFIRRFIQPIARARHEDKQQFEGTKMKKYQKRSELQEKTALGYKTLIDEFDMDNVNDALAKVPGMEFALHLGSKSPRPIKGGGHSMLKIEDINESVAQITGGMDGLFEVKKQK